ncbi:MAG: DUF2061 domain-containing protein [Bacteroidetes bacterium]|nr:DUF2061 domain-containing protein [Bacteroidota bacterium]MBL7104232.1 DUF2061 domain-containing protein [Bacteroidales bacterium]
MNSNQKHQNNNHNKEITIAKDTPGRSLTKAITWRILASGATFLVAFVIFKRFTEKNLPEVLEGATFVTILEFVVKILIYYLHERLWTNIKWGKYMKRRYWKGRAWKKLYREMHKQ